jgi:hypothetical protein
MGKSIYDVDEKAFLTNDQLEERLASHLLGLSFAKMALRTRSKAIKIETCKALGYDIPSSFKRSKPKFPCQNLDVYSQQSNNLQIWNQDIDLSRRYAILGLDADGKVYAVRVISGEDLADLDTTGTLTIKYQARVPAIEAKTKFVEEDSPNLGLSPSEKPTPIPAGVSASDAPVDGSLMTTEDLYKQIETIIGTTIPKFQITQERKRGDALAKLVSKRLGYSTYQDNGQFPDIPNQLLEVKLETSPTIDLGLHRPDSLENVKFTYKGRTLSVKDMRYLIAVGKEKQDEVSIDGVFITSGDKFFDIFELFGGNVKNKKLQVPLPIDFFDKGHKN